MIPFKDGFLNFNFLNLPKIFETLLFVVVSTLASVFSKLLSLKVTSLLLTADSAAVLMFCLTSSATVAETVGLGFSSVVFVEATGCSWVVC